MHFLKRPRPILKRPRPILKRPRPISFWLALLVVVGVLPAWAATAVAVRNSYERERATLERSTVVTAADFEQTVDRYLASAASALQVLATSPHLTSGDLYAFHAQARDVLETQVGNEIMLTEPSGQQLMSTLRPYGETLPRTSTPETTRTVLQSGKPVFSNFHIGASSGEPQVAVAVPVIHDASVLYVLKMGIVPERLHEILREQQFPSGWVAWVFDSNGTIVASTEAAQGFVGRKGSPDLLRRIAAAAEGTMTGSTLEGVPVLTSFHRSAMSGWSVAIGIPTIGLTTELRRRLWWSGIGTGAIFLLALFFARQISLRIARSIQALIEPALAVASGSPMVVPPLEIAEADEVGRAITTAGSLIEERTRTRDDAQALARAHFEELAHTSRVSIAGEMAAAIAHELSQPLSAIETYGRGCLRVLATKMPDRDMLNEGMREIVQQAGRASNVLTRLREFVSNRPFRRRLLPVRPIIDTAVGLMESELARAGVRIEINIEPKLPSVFADKVQIEQVLLNLLRNAIDAMEAAGSDQPLIVLTARGTNNHSVEISVADNGSGVGDDMRERLFQPFTTTKPSGMGIGLSISRSIIEAHGGSLRVRDRDGMGADFFFDLPTRVPERKDNAAEYGVCS